MSFAMMRSLTQAVAVFAALSFGYAGGLGAVAAVRRARPASVKTTWVVAPPQPVSERSPILAPQVLELRGNESDRLYELRRAPESRERGGTLSHGLSLAGAEFERLSPLVNETVRQWQLPNLGIGMTQKTLDYVRYFSESEEGARIFQRWVKRSGRYQDLILDELRHRDVPDDLRWVAMIESGFSATAVSPAGAVGLWQFMPQTGAVYGLYQDADIDERRDPRKATRAAAHHLRDLYARLRKWDLALAAYNLGYERLLTAIDEVGSAEFADLVGAGALPRETAHYVPKVMAAGILMNNLEHFGLDAIELDAPEDGAEMLVPGGTRLATVAKAAGVSTQLIKRLNPQFLRDTTSREAGDSVLLVPSDALERTQVKLPLLLASLDHTEKPSLDERDRLGGRAFGRRGVRAAAKKR